MGPAKHEKAAVFRRKMSGNMRSEERGLRPGSGRARESMVFGRDRHENSFLIYVNVNADKHSPACGKIPYDLTSSEADCECLAGPKFKSLIMQA